MAVSNSTRHAFRQLFYRHIFTARRLFAPDEVVGFIDNQQIPFGIAQVFQTLLVTAGEVQRTDHQLFGFERVKRIVLRFGVAFVVKQGETQIETAQHFDQPLMLQGFWHNNQHAFCRARKQLLMQDHPGFNGFAQTHFICQQYARRMTATHIVGDVELMRIRLVRWPRRPLHGMRYCSL